MIKVYYNDNDPRCCAWIRELIKEGLIPDGEIDSRSIEQVQPSDLCGFDRCHFFAGIAVWEWAIRRSGFSDLLTSCWTGSCPCQPLSVAGKQEGHEDARHLWPSFYRLIRECQPAIVFGEQVDSRLGIEWVSGVQADLEDAGYDFGAASLNAAGVGAPHIRQRIYWLAYSERGAAERHGLTLAGAPRRAQDEAHERERIRIDARNGRDLDGMENPAGIGRRGRRDGDSSGSVGSLQAEGRSDASGLDNAAPVRRQHEPNEPGMLGPGNEPTESGRSIRTASSSGWLADNGEPRLEGHAGEGDNCDEPGRNDTESAGPTSESSTAMWRDSRWHFCQDEKHRRVPIESSLFPLADGSPGRVGLLRGAGNAIVGPLAEAFIRAGLEAIVDIENEDTAQ